MIESAAAKRVGIKLEGVKKSFSINFYNLNGISRSTKKLRNINGRGVSMNFIDVFTEKLSIVQQIDRDFPEHQTKSATRADVKRSVTPVGMPSVNYGLVLRILTTKKECSEKLEHFISHGKDRREVNESIYNYFIRNLSETSNLQSITVQVCQDQEGSRFVQNQLDLFTRSETGDFFREIEENALELSTNLFGNYVIQKIIPMLNNEELNILIERFRNNIHVLSTHVYGCRVIQKLIDYIENVDCIIDELQNCILELIASPNGNHVIQKCIDKSQLNKNGFLKRITVEFEKDCINLAQQRYGCRVLQRLFELSDPSDVQKLLTIISTNVGDLINDRYGNYVIQHLIQSDYLGHKNKIFEYIIKNAVELSKYKFSSNVIEKCVSNATEQQLNEFLVTFSSIQSDGKPALFHMCTDMYANYVVQKFYDTVDFKLKEKMKLIVGRYLKDIKVIPFTKHILNKFDSK